MNRPQTLLPFMDILTSLVGIIILMTIVFALSLSESETVLVRILHRKTEAVGAHRELRPIYVICSSTGIEIGNSKLPVPETDRDMEDLRNILETEMELEGEGAFLFALVRPDAYDAFRRVRSAVDKLGFRLGYEPINSRWKLHNL